MDVLQLWSLNTWSQKLYTNEKLLNAFFFLLPFLNSEFTMSVLSLKIEEWLVLLATSIMRTIYWIEQRVFVCSTFDKPTIKQSSYYCGNYFKKNVPLPNLSFDLKHNYNLTHSAEFTSQSHSYAFCFQKIKHWSVLMDLAIN